MTTFARTIRDRTITVDATRYDGDYLYGPSLTLSLEPVAGRTITLRVNLWHDRRDVAWSTDRDEHQLACSVWLNLIDSRSDRDAEIPF